MKGIRSFLVLVVIAAALGGYLYYDSKREPGDDKKLEKVFADAKSDKITLPATRYGVRWIEPRPTAPAASLATQGSSTSMPRMLRRRRCMVA